MTDKITGLATWQYKAWVNVNDGIPSILWVDYDSITPVRLTGSIGKKFVTLKLPTDDVMVKRKAAERIRAVGIEKAEVIFPIGLPNEAGFYDHRIKLTNLEFA